ncbi:MAG: hypothetical protein K8S97_10430 [Anaerolineae bacterium]|nr:hypothetical protein [Anaerolineae bacterium]
MSKNREQLRERAWRAIFSAAFFNVESAVIIALSILLFGLGYQPFGWWQNAYWLIFGVLAEALYLGVTITDPNMAQQAVSNMLSERFEPDDIKNADARERLKRALEYHRLILESARRHAGTMRTHIETTAHELEPWIAQIYRLARYMDEYQENAVIRMDRRMVELDLKNLERRKNTEDDPRVVEELEDALQAKRIQFANLQTLDSQIKRADIQLDQTLSALGTVYAQVQLLGSREIDGGRAERLQDAIKEEVTSLEDTLAALDEVQSYQGTANS